MRKISIYRFVVGLVLVVAFGLSGCNALRVIFPKRSYDTERPDIPEDLGAPAILVFTKTNGFRHEEAIPAGLELIRGIAARRGWSLFHTENGAAFNEGDLSRFVATVWHNTSGDTLNAEQKQAFRRWLESGGGFVGLHGAGGDPSYEWNWYVETLLGAQFIGHIMGPQFQDATLRIEAADHPTMRGLPESFVHNEEWYSFDRSVRERGYRVLATVDESTYSPRAKILWMDEDLSMGDHPVIWSHCVGQGRAYFNALGHQAAAYATVELEKLVENGISWAAGFERDECRGGG